MNSIHVSTLPKTLPGECYSQKIHVICIFSHALMRVKALTFIVKTAEPLSTALLAVLVLRLDSATPVALQGLLIPMGGVIA